MVAQWLWYSSLCRALVEFSALLVCAALTALLNLLIKSQCIHKIKGACGGVVGFMPFVWLSSVPALQPWVLYK